MRACHQSTLIQLMQYRRVILVCEMLCVAPIAYVYVHHMTAKRFIR